MQNPSAARSENLFAVSSFYVACERLQLCLLESQKRIELLLDFEGLDR